MTVQAAPQPPTLSDLDTQVATSMVSWLAYTDGPRMVLGSILAHVYGEHDPRPAEVGTVYASLSQPQGLTMTTELELADLRRRLAEEDRLSVEAARAEYAAAQAQETSLGLVAVPVGYAAVPVDQAQALDVTAVRAAVPVEVEPARRRLLWGRTRDA